MQIRSLTILRRLAGYFRPHLPILLSVGILLILTTAVMVARPLILRSIIDGALSGGDRKALYHDFSLFLVLLFVGVAAGYTQTLIASRLGLSIVNRLKHDLLRHILGLDLSWFDKSRVGWLIARVEGDTEQLKSFCSHITINLVSNLLMFASILVILFRTDAVIAGAMTGILAVLMLLVFIFLSRVRTLYDQVRGLYAELCGFITEYVQGIPVIQHFNRGEEIRTALHTRNKERYHGEVKASLAEYGFWAFILFLVETVLIAVVLWIGMGHVAAGAMTVGTLVMFLEFSRQITWPIITFSEIFNQIQRAFVAAERVFGILDERPQVIDAGGDDTSLDPSVIEFRDVTFAYGENDPVLKNVSFTIKRGETIALVGPSGGGKTTTASLLCRFYDPVSGSILVDGRDLREISIPAWRRSVGLVLQDVYLFPGTVLDNLRVLNENVDPAMVREAARQMGADPFITRMNQGYETELAERGGNLSQGERQLLSFTRALAFQPKLLVLDEATASIDPDTERKIQHGLSKLLSGRTALVIAHRLSTIRHADRILVIENGRVAESGRHEELLARGGVYHRLWNLQAAETEERA